MNITLLFLQFLVLAMDVYENGTYPMDDSTLRIIEKTVSILKKSSVVNEDEFQWSRYS